MERFLSDLKEKERKQVAISAFWVALGTVTSRGIGFLREIAVAHYFSRTETDVFYVAFRLPNLFRRLFGEGALTVSFIPVLTDFLKNDDKKGARELTSAVFTLLFVILSVLTVLGTLWPQSMVKPLTHGEGFLGVPGKVDLTVHQAQIMFCYIFLVSLYAFGMGVLNTLRVFWVPAVAPALWNVSMLVGILFFRGWFAIHSDVLAWSTVVGGVLQAAILIPLLKKHEFIPVFAKWWNNPAVKKVLRAMVPSILGLSVMQLGVIINTYFASQLEEGSNSWINWADRILEFPLSLFAVSVGTVALPTLAAFWSRGDKEGMREASLHALKLSLFMAVPCAAGVFVLAHPIVKTLFEHGRFTSYDTQMTAAIIRIYGLSVITATGVRVLAPTFYAMKNTWVPALSAVIALTCHMFIARILMKYYGVRGLATSSVLSGAINLSFLILCYRLTGTRLHLVELFKPVGKFVVASCLLMVVGSFHPLFLNALGDSHWAQVIGLLTLISLCAASYLGVAWVLKTHELLETVEELQKRISARLRRT